MTASEEAVGVARFIILVLFISIVFENEPTPPTNSFFAIAIPPAVVIVPPLVEDDASVVLDNAKPPLSRTAPVLSLVVVVESFDVIFGKVNVLVAYVIPDDAETALVPLPINTPFAVKVVAPVPPYATQFLCYTYSS